MNRTLNGILILLLATWVVSCESKNQDLSVNFINNDLKIQPKEISINAKTRIIDSVRTDETNLSVPIGNTKNLFGTTVSSFASQVSYSGGILGQDLAKNAQLKSVYLKIVVRPKSLSANRYDELLNSSKTVLIKGNNRDDVDTLRTQYTVDSIFDVQSDKLDLSVYELGNRLDVFSSDYYSDGKAYGENGTKTPFVKAMKLGQGSISQTVTDSIYAFYDKTNRRYLFSSALKFVSYQIPLDKDKFETIFKSVQDGSITNITAFKEKFPGIVIEPTNTEKGFTFLADASKIFIQMNYTYDASQDDKKSDIENASVAFTIDPSKDHRVSKYKRTLSKEFENAEKDNDDLYLQGQGGSELTLDINQNEINAFKRQITANGKINASIVDAYIDLYVDTSKSDSDLPFWLYLYDNKNKREISDYVLLTNVVRDIDYNSPSIIDAYQRIVGGIYDKKNKRYRIKVTQFIKNIIEDKKYIDLNDTDKDGDNSESLNFENVQLALRIGQRVNNSFFDRSKPDFSIKSTTNAYQPGGLVAYGSNVKTTSNSKKRLKLVILYSSKE